MGRMIRFELEKIVKRKVVLVCLAAVFGVLLFALERMPDSYTVKHEGKVIGNREAITYDRSVVEKYAGKLTDEKVQSILKEYGSIEDEQNKESNMLQGGISYLFSDQEGNWNGCTVKDAFPQLKEAPVIGYSQGFEDFSIFYSSFFMFLGVVIMIAIAPVFADEYTLHTDGLLLSTRNGRRKCVWAKVIASLLFALVLVVSVTCIIGWRYYDVFGISGADASIQITKRGMFEAVPVAMTCLESVFYTVLTGVTAMLLHTMIVIVVSIVSKNSFHAIITSAAIYFVPLCVSFVLENEVALKVFSLFPAPHTNTHLVLEFAVTLLPWLEVAIMAGMLLLICPVGKRLFLKHEVT